MFSQTNYNNADLKYLTKRKRYYNKYMNQNDPEFAKDFNELKAWKISEEEFPSTGSNKDKLKFFINYAILAPSGHNTQPWRFDVYNNIIVMYADRTRALPVVDPEDRELTISCGAALSHLLLGLDKIVFCILYFALRIWFHEYYYFLIL